MFRLHCLPAITLLILVASSAVRAEDLYPFAAQRAGNSFDSYRCLGLAASIECLEEGSQIEGLESSQDLASRLWSKLNDSKDEVAELVYYSDLRLRDGTSVPICSKAAIEEIGLLVQEEYSQFLNNRLWRVNVNPDPSAPQGRALLEIRQKYLDLDNSIQEYSVTSEYELKHLFKKEQDVDGLVALSGRGLRFFERGTPPKVIDQRNVEIDPNTGKYPTWIPSLHAFLLTYDKNKNQFYVYDSDDARGKWPVTVEGHGSAFRIRWRIDDHMGNGPSQQSYHDVKLLGRFLADMTDIVKSDNDRDAKSTPTKKLEP